MLKKMLAGLGIALFSLAASLPVSAQEIATLALRNGERPSGQLIDLGAGGFTLRINGQDRQIPASEVSAVEFVVGAPPAAAQVKVNAGQPVVVLRSGEVIDGRLSDIGGTSPLRLTVDTASGSRDFSSGDVAQIYVNPIAAATPTATTGQAVAAPVGSITVPANQAWTDTGLVVRRGDRVSVSATGDIMIAPNASSGTGGNPGATVAGTRYPLNGTPAGALIGRIGNGTPFLASGPEFVATATGRLMLGINDNILEDNTGNFVVTLSPRSR